MNGHDTIPATGNNLRHYALTDRNGTLMNSGDTFHGLKLLAYCGGGAYGEVFYCEDLTHKKMAVKIISKQKIGLHCRRELKGITNYRKLTIDAPNLLRIFQVEEDEENFFYTMEAADNLSSTGYKPDTLAARLEQGALPDNDIFPVVSGIYEGIKTIHNAGFAHCDIKPDNILFVNGIPKLADMGLLSSLSMTMSALAGTFEFIPPEIRSSDNFSSHDNISRQKCDLYAFGKVVYCIITGRDALCFPSIPENLSCSLPVKYFLRFSWQLCSNAPAKRLVSPANTDKALSAIKQKLLFGETWLDKFRYALQLSQQNDPGAVKDFQSIKPGIWTFFLALVTPALVIRIIPEDQLFSMNTAESITCLTLSLTLLWLLYYAIFDIAVKLVRCCRRQK